MEPHTYTLYHHPLSIYSIMVRLAIAMRGKPQNGEDILIDEQQVDIVETKEQLTEHFLCDINPKGHVPVLAGKALDKPMSDSVDITHYLAKLFPRLIPGPHQAQIAKLLDELHSISVFSLTFTGSRYREDMRAEMQRRLQKDISPRHREALETKIKIDKPQRHDALEPEYIAQMVERAKTVMIAMKDQLSGNDKWLFGLDQPSALDAHLVPFIVRMRDVDRHELVPSQLMAYAEEVEKTEYWESVMKGRSTKPF